MHHHCDRLQHLEIPSANTDTFQHCDSHILHARPTVSGSLWFQRSASEVTSGSRINNSTVCSDPVWNPRLTTRKNGCLRRMVAPGKRHSVLFMPLILVFLSRKVSICPKRRGSTEGPLSESRSPDESCEEQRHCQQTVFLTRWKRNAAFCQLGILECAPPWGAVGDPGQVPSEQEHPVPPVTLQLLLLRRLGPH